MKKITLLAIAGLAICFASCKKERTCECTNSSPNSGLTTTVYKKIKKSDAKDHCLNNSNTSSTTSGNNTQTTTFTEKCTLK